MNDTEQSASAISDDNRTEAATGRKNMVFPKFGGETFRAITASSQPDLEQTTTSSSSSVEEYERQKLLQEEGKRFIQELIFLIQHEEFEYGVDTRADALVRRYIELYPLPARDWINRAYVEYFANVPILVGLLRVIARLDYEEIYPQGQTMATAALSHKDTEVIDCGVRALESWGTLESLKSLEILENVHISPQWLQKYVEKVVFYLREEHNASAR